MEDRVRPDITTPLDTGEAGEYMLNPRYDWIRTFPWIEWGIINVATESGTAQLHVPEQTAEYVHEVSGIPLVRLEWITDTDYEKYLQCQEDSLEQWFDM